MSRAPTKRVTERLWAKVDKNGPIPEHRPELGPCWMWTACTDSAGYGQFGVGSRSDSTLRIRQAHRVTYELLVGPIPDGLELDHLCRVRHCVNPAHLEPVTHAENVRRSPLKGGLWRRDLTRCKHGHEFTPENTYRHGGKRHCRTCRRLRRRRPS